MIGLVGKVAPAKVLSSILVCRFYDPDSGSVVIDGHDLRDVRLSQWRKHIGIVMQDPFLFRRQYCGQYFLRGTRGTFEDIARAARAAKAHDFILDKEEGYDTIVGEGGVELSGGERQRIAIARAILNDLLS